MRPRAFVAYQTASLGADDGVAVSPDLIARVRRLGPGQRLVRERRGGRWIETVVEKRAPVTPPARAPKTPTAVRRVLPPAQAGGGEVAYVEVSRDDVRYQARREAEVSVRFFARKHGLTGVPGVRWFRAALPGEPPTFTRSQRILAMADRARHEIWLRVDRSPAQIFELVAHEVAHLAGAGEDGARRAELECWTLAAPGGMW